jgi:hypothetical protein
MVCCHAEPPVAPVKPKMALPVAPAQPRTADRLRGSARPTTAFPDAAEPSYHAWLVFSIKRPPPGAHAEYVRDTLRGAVLGAS